MKISHSLGIGVFGLLGMLVSHAAIEVAYTQLDNGMKVILYPSRLAPTVACRLFYVTGSVHEAAGRTGIAHMLEHMLFKGTRKVGVKDPALDARLEKKLDGIKEELAKTPKTDTALVAKLSHQRDSLTAKQSENLVKYELWDAYEKAGGSGLNAFTSDLMTAYIVTLPKNKLELYFWLESDRMQNAVMRQFDPEHAVVMEERRMRVEDNPLGRYWESLMGVFYEAHPMRLPTIGYPSDIRYLNKKQAEEHYREYYKPNNCILVLAGDLDTSKTLEQVKRYFGKIPRGSEFPPIVTEEPPPAGEKRLITHRDDAKPRYDLLFHTPGFPSDDLYALDIVEGVLSGQSGRLNKKLVKGLKIALDASAGNSVDKYTSTFQVEVEMDGHPDVSGVEKAVWEVLDSLGRYPLSDRELQRAKNQVAARSVRALENMENLATELAYWEMRGGWANINHFPESVSRVTPQQVMEVCKKTFIRDASTVGIVTPTPLNTNSDHGIKSNEKGVKP